MNLKNIATVLLCGATVVAMAQGPQRGHQGNNKQNPQAQQPENRQNNNQNRQQPGNQQKPQGNQQPKNNQPKPDKHHDQGPQGQLYFPADGYYVLSTNCGSKYYVSMRAGISGNRIGLDDREEPLYIKRVGDCYYIYDDANLSLALDLNASQAVNGGRIQFYNPNGSVAQKWKFIKTPDGRLIIQSACNKNFVLDVPGNNPSRGAHIQLYKYNGNSNQCWQLKKFNGKFNVDRNHKPSSNNPNAGIGRNRVSAGHSPRR